LVDDHETGYLTLEKDVFKLLAQGLNGWLTTELFHSVSQEETNNFADFFLLEQSYIVNPANREAYQNRGVRYLMNIMHDRGNLFKVFIQRNIRLDSILLDFTTTAMVAEENGKERIGFSLDEMRAKYTYDTDRGLNDAIKVGLLTVMECDEKKEIVTLDPAVQAFLGWEILRGTDMTTVRRLATMDMDRMKRMQMVDVLSSG
jgi:hypothetical protein